MIEPTDRRTVLRGVAVIGAGAALTACGGGESDPPTSTDSSADATSEAPEEGGTSLGKAADIPVGGGKIFPDEKIVVTQPTAGDFRAFSAVCTHNGCVVASVKAPTINCACHGSKYSIEDGSVVNGPAPAALAKKTVTDEGGTLKLG